MIPALLGALLPVALGIGVGWTAGARRSWLGPARWIALVAALGVVALVLLPESASSIGWLAALGALGLGLVAPWLAERLIHRTDHDHRRGGWLAMAGVVAHQGVDGFEIGAAHALETGAWGVTGAIAVHTVPLVAALLVELGVRLSTALWLVAGTAIGVTLGVLAPAAAPALVAWLPPIVGGLLLHLLWHDLGHWVH